MRASGERQRQNRQVAIDRPIGKSLQSGNRQRHNEQVDQHQIGGKEPRGGANPVLIVVLDHGDVELARQKHDRERR